MKEEVSQSYYNYDKIFIKLMVALNICETKKQLDYFSSSLADDFRQNAPTELVEYLNSSIKNKIISLAKRDNLDLGKLRAISKL